MKQCWTCTHRPVCKHWASAAETKFPFTDDSRIGPFVNGIAEVLATACAWYETRPGTETEAGDKAG
jgi:hypothetical protein